MHKLPFFFFLLFIEREMDGYSALFVVLSNCEISVISASILILQLKRLTDVESNNIIPAVSSLCRKRKKRIEAKRREREEAKTDGYESLFSKCKGRCVII